MAPIHSVQYLWKCEVTVVVYVYVAKFRTVVKVFRGRFNSLNQHFHSL
jgi:hypothetical protein